MTILTAILALLKAIPALAGLASALAGYLSDRENQARIAAADRAVDDAVNGVLAPSVIGKQTPDQAPPISCRCESGAGICARCAENNQPVGS